MIENEIVITTKHGRMPTFAVRPEEPGQYPGIIFYMDAPGIREELRNMARRIAKHGYYLPVAGHVLPPGHRALRHSSAR